MDQQVKAPAMPAILNLSSVSWDAHGARRTLLSQVVLRRTHGKCASQQVIKLRNIKIVAENIAHPLRVCVLVQSSQHP